MLFGKKKKEGSGLQAEVTRIPSGNKQGSFKKKTDLGQERYMGDIGSMETPKPKAEAAAPEPVKAPGNKRKTKTRKKKLIKGRKEKIAALKIPKAPRTRSRTAVSTKTEFSSLKGAFIPKPMN